MSSTIIVAEQLPIKQGLKLPFFTPMSSTIIVADQLPIKQGLKR
jgi:hypothetical protein